MKALTLLLLISPLPVFAGPKILVVGDSHTSGIFGKKLDEKLRAFPGYEVELHGRCSTSPQHWYAPGYTTHCGSRDHGALDKVATSKVAKTPEIEKLLRDFRPDHTVIALGTNQLQSGLEKSAQRIRKIIRSVVGAGSGCSWVGPPKEAFVSDDVQEKFYAMLALATKEEGCDLVDSRKPTHYPKRGGDKKHYDAFPEICDDWAQFVVDKVREHVKAREATGACAQCGRKDRSPSREYGSPL